MLEKFFPKKEKVDKLNAWNEKMKELDRMADKLGMPIDENIKEAITAMNLMGIPTFSSCGGHIGERFNFPYLMGHAENEPKYKFIGQQEILEKLAKEYAMPVKELEDNLYKYPEIDKKFYNFIEENDIGTTDEYNNWYTENIRLEQKTSGLLEEFNKGKIEAVLFMDAIADAYRVESNKEDTHPNTWDPVTATEKILKAQREMHLFTEFLKEKYFQNK